MDHKDHIALLSDGVDPSGVWADLGSGRGAFTLALADLLGPQGQIFSVDKDQRALQEQKRLTQKAYPGVSATYIRADFSRPLDLPPLDGILMANSLHFLRRKVNPLRRIKKLLKPQGRFILVEYNTDRRNLWVPHPLSYPTWETLSLEVGFSKTRKLAGYPSRFLGEIYSALST